MKPAERLTIYERDGGLCGFCGELVDVLRWDMDHQQPRRLGGPTEPLNLRPAHPRCNRQAGAKLAALIETVPKPVVMTIRIPPDVLEQVKVLAEIETRSVNGELVQLVKEALAARGKP